MEEERLARMVYLWGMAESKWAKNCMRMVYNSGMRVRRVEVERERPRFEWKMSDCNGMGCDWDVKEWRKMIDDCVKEEGLRKWRMGMEVKGSLAWYKMKGAPQYVSWYDGSLGGDLLFQARAQCMNVNARNYRWSDSGNKVCQMCEKGVDETVAHVILECEKYERERLEMLEVAKKEVLLHASEVNGVIVRTESEWMLLLLGLNGEASECMMEAVKEFLERVW